MERRIQTNKHASKNVPVGYLLPARAVDGPRDARQMWQVTRVDVEDDAVYAVRASNDEDIPPFWWRANRQVWEQRDG